MVEAEKGDHLAFMQAKRHQPPDGQADIRCHRRIADLASGEHDRRLVRVKCGVSLDPMREVHFAYPPVTSITTAIEESPAAHPVNSPRPPPRKASSSISSIIERVPIGACGWPQTSEQPKLLILPISAPVSRAKTTSFTANGLWILIASIWSIDLAAAANALFADGTAASGMWASATRALPKPSRRTLILALRLSSRARSGVATMIAAFPSAG